MRKKGDHHLCDGVYFLPGRGVIKVEETSREVMLSQTQRNFLLTLMEKPRQVVTYDELRVKVWPHEPELNQRVQHTIHVTKGHLIRLLEGAGISGDLIESVPGQGYRLNAQGLQTSEGESAEGTAGRDDAGSATPADEVPHELETPAQRKPTTIFHRLLGEHSTFITVSSFLYGLLFLIALLLEAAYRFDVYGMGAAWMGFPVALINMAALASALVLARKRLREKKSGGMFAGLILLIAGIILSGWLASLCLPDTPVTLSRFQAQPAFPAFLKNAVIYFLPLAVFFLLMPFYVIAAVKLRERGLIIKVPPDAILVRPNALIMLCLAIIAYSLPLNFYLLDNLQTGTYHSLFVTLIFMRFIVYFGLGFGSLLWYKAVLGREKSLHHT